MASWEDKWFRGLMYKSTLYKRFDSTQTTLPKSFLYMKDICSRSPFHLHRRLLLSFTHAFLLWLQYMASGYSAWFGHTPAGTILCHAGIFLPMLLSVSIKPCFQWQTGGIFLTAPDWMVVVDSRPWHGAFHPSYPCISLTVSLSSE